MTKESDLNLIPINQNTFAQDLNTYKLAYYTQTQNLIPILSKDLQIINDALTQQIAIPENKVADITSKYQKIADALITVALPAIPGSSGSLNHLNIINSLKRLITI